MTEKEFRDFMDKIEKDSIKKKSDEKKNESEKKDFKICGDENDKGECCLWEKGHKGEHEYHSEKEIHAEAKIINDRPNPDVDDYIKEKLTGKKEPEGGFVKIDPHNSFKDKPSETHLDFRHNKTELAIAIGILAIAVGIGSFLLYDNYDDILLFINETISDFEISDISFTEDEKPRPKSSTENVKVTPGELSRKYYYQIISDGTVHAQFYDGGNIPKGITVDNNMKIPFHCAYDSSRNIEEYFGVFQLLNGTTLEVNLFLDASQPSFSEVAGQGHSIIVEGICP